jgi:hypothetical protein
MHASAYVKCVMRETGKQLGVAARSYYMVAEVSEVGGYLVL